MPLLKYIDSIYELNNDRKSKILSIFKKSSKKKNTILINQGNVCNKVFFIIQGAMRTYTVNKKGREYTRLIEIENNFIGNFSSFKDLSISNETIATLESTTFLYANRTDVLNLINHDFILKSIYSSIIENFNIKNINKMNSILSLSDHDKMKHFYENYKNFISRFPDRVNASFLNMSRENYSRYKKIWHC